MPFVPPSSKEYIGKHQMTAGLQHSVRLPEEICSGVEVEGRLNTYHGVKENISKSQL